MAATAAAIAGPLPIHAELKACAKRMARANDMIANSQWRWGRHGPGALHLSFATIDDVRTFAGPATHFQWLDRNTAVVAGLTQAITFIDACAAANEEAVLMLTLDSTATTQSEHYIVKLKQLVVVG